VVFEGRGCYVVLNLYPHDSGHLLVVPYRHVATLGGLSPDELQEVGVLTQRAEAALTEAYRPHGLNVGINLGKSAGAGILEHLCAGGRGSRIRARIRAIASTKRLSSVLSSHRVGERDAHRERALELVALGLLGLGAVAAEAEREAGDQYMPVILAGDVSLRNRNFR
jgi:hypothetical protein